MSGHVRRVAVVGVLVVAIVAALGTAGWLWGRPALERAELARLPGMKSFRLADGSDPEDSFGESDRTTEYHADVDQAASDADLDRIESALSSFVRARRTNRRQVRVTVGVGHADVPIGSPGETGNLRILRAATPPEAVASVIDDDVVRVDMPPGSDLPAAARGAEDRAYAAGWRPEHRYHRLIVHAWVPLGANRSGQQTLTCYPWRHPEKVPILLDLLQRTLPRKSPPLLNVNVRPDDDPRLAPIIINGSFEDDHALQEEWQRAVAGVPEISFSAQ